MLFETFRVWQNSDASVNAVADRLFCHPNTVRHRLRRIEKGTGRSLVPAKGCRRIMFSVRGTSPAHVTMLSAIPLPGHRRRGLSRRAARKVEVICRGFLTGFLCVGGVVDRCCFDVAGIAQLRQMAP